MPNVSSEVPGEAGLSTRDAMIRSFQQQLDAERDDRAGERLCWIIACFVLFDMAMFQHLGDVGVLVTFLLQVFCLACMAQQWNVYPIAGVLKHFFSRPGPS